jgi:superfamily I DNA/RNA helicase/Zn-dependent peptidase ImmA (M78 family)
MHNRRGDKASDPCSLLVAFIALVLLSMNPFESARLEAQRLRQELADATAPLNVRGFELVRIACEHLDVKLKCVEPSFSLLKKSDATINVKKKWIYVRNDVGDDVKAFLVAHEIGHLRLHPLVLGTFEVKQESLTGDGETNGVKEVESYGARERQELQANVFSREFLLPRQDARHDFLDIGLSAITCAKQRGLPLELVRLQIYDAVLLPEVKHSAKSYSLPSKPTPAQEPAVNSDASVSFIEAGPGTGKTTTLLLRLRRLIAQGADPNKIVVLTFSNKAARELVERARAGGIEDADRVWIGTFHAFGLEFLRKFGNYIGLGPIFPVLDKLAALAMLEDELPSLQLQSYDPLSNPLPWLENVIDTIRRAKDEVFDGAQFKAAVDTQPCADPELQLRRQDVAAIFERYETILKSRKAIDLTDLLCETIRLLQAQHASIERFLADIEHVMVDEYQDVNRASALLVKELARHAKTLWVVGDANQAIYAFMGASSNNLSNFEQDFPGAVPIPLLRNHRSSQEIVDVFTNVARANPAGRSAVALEAEKGPVGHGPQHIASTDAEQELDALAWRIGYLREQAVNLAEQAIITYRNSDGAKIAQRLEERGIPVLYLGSIFERPEIKDLICLLQLAADPLGASLVRQWHSSGLQLSRQAADAVFAQVTKELPWTEIEATGLGPEDRLAFSNLKRLCTGISPNDSPWVALSQLLLEDGQWLRGLTQQQGQATANALMAVWQFVHFCRTADGTGKWATVRNLSQRIRDRVRMGEDRSMRMVPPEAEGMEAVRILTSHGSKGLEFDAVHFLRVSRKTYQQPTNRANKLLPDAVLSEESAAKVLLNERHNLLYVAVSRPRQHLTAYTVDGEELPDALAAQFQPLQPSAPALPKASSNPPTTQTTPMEVSLDEYLEYIKCPQRREMSARAKSRPREELQLYRAVDLATRNTVRALMADASRLSDGMWQAVMEEQLQALKLHEHPSAPAIRDKVSRSVQRAQAALLEGGQMGTAVGLKLGPLHVSLKPDQILGSGAQQTLRFIRTGGKSNYEAMKQPVAALLAASSSNGGPKPKVEVVTLADGEKRDVGSVRAATLQTYMTKAQHYCSGIYPASPSEERACHTCAFMFPCSKRTED